MFDLSLREYLERRLAALKTRIDQMPEETIIQKSEELLVEEFCADTQLECPVLNLEEKTADPQPTKPLSLTLSVPFRGHHQLFNHYAGQFGANIVKGTVLTNSLELKYVGTEQQVKTDMNRDINCIQHELVLIGNALAPHNKAVREIASKHIAARYEEKKERDETLRQLGIPIKPKHTPTIELPAIKQKLRDSLPPIGSPVEPVLGENIYLHILKICSDMGRAIESSPAVFAQLKHEEDLRVLFQVLLNGHYEGAALAEAFNLEGKTDIVVKHGNHNLFIAEFKKWGGSSSHKAAIDQLLGYVAYRDTKTALIVFVQTKDFEQILEKMHDATVGHPNFLSEESAPVSAISARRYRFFNKNDKDKAFSLTTLAVHMPALSDTAKAPD